VKSHRVLLLILWLLLPSSAHSADLTLSYGTPEQVGMSADVLVPDSWNAEHED